MGAPPQLSTGVLARALAEESFNGLPITVQVLGMCSVAGLAPCRAACTPMHTWSAAANVGCVQSAPQLPRAAEASVSVVHIHI